MSKQKIINIIIGTTWMLMALFLYFRQTDGSGATNNTLNQFVSLFIWLFIGLIILVISWIYWHHRD
ncbi:DUF3923 family protein [Companilactobacillus kimchiensis]|nr:DUF3923 family protein [Companilactobacillus kimchiensis]